MNLPQQPLQQKTLSLAEEKAIEDKINYLEQVKDRVEIGGLQGVEHQVKDEKALDENLARLRNIRDTHKVERVTGKEREAVEKEARVLFEKLDPKMTWGEYMNTKRRDGMPYLRLVRTIQKWETDQRRIADLERWKSLQRRLEPEDPHISSFMQLFDRDSK